MKKPVKNNLPKKYNKYNIANKFGYKPKWMISSKNNNKHYNKI